MKSDDIAFILVCGPFILFSMFLLFSLFTMIGMTVIADIKEECCELFKKGNQN